MGHIKDRSEHLTFQVTVGERGRIVLPAKLRESAGLQPGDQILANLEPDGSIKLVERRTVLRRLRGSLRKPEHGERSIVDEFLAERREEAARE